MGEFHFSDKEAIKKNSAAILGLGVNKVQQHQQQQKSLEVFPNKITMMLHHNHHHHPFSCDGDGPTSFTHHINKVFSPSSSVPSPAIEGGAPLQPFDLSSAAYSYSPTFK